jgi:hypothetical protein
MMNNEVADRQDVITVICDLTMQVSSYPTHGKSLVLL